MVAPVVKMFNSDDTIEFNTDSSPIDFGNVDPGTTGTAVEVHLWNNKGGTQNQSAMQDVRIGIVTRNGYTSGDTVAYGKEIVEGHYMQCKSLTLQEANYSAIGGSIVKTMADIKGSQILAPGKPTGIPQTDLAGLMAVGSVYYRVSAVDESGETLAGVESDEIVVESPDNAVQLSWTAVEGATGYKIFRTVDSGIYNGYSFIGLSASSNYTDRLASPLAGVPLSVATVTFQHSHKASLQPVIPPSITPGSVEFRVRVLYRYSYP